MTNYYSYTLIEYKRWRLIFSGSFDFLINYVSSHLTDCQYLLDKINYNCLFRPEFIEFFGLNVSIIPTAGVASTTNGNDNAAKANDDDTEEPPTVVIQKKIFFR